MRMGPTSTRVGIPVIVHGGVGTFVLASARAWAVVDWGYGVVHVLLLDSVEGVDGCGVEGVLAGLAAGLAAAMDAWREVRSRIMRSFCSCLSAWTVCACWWRLSRRENCLE